MVSGSPALAIARTCFNSSLRASASGTREAKHLDRTVRLELEDEELVADQYLEVSEWQMHELLTRDVQRERAALVEHVVGGHHIEHRPGQGLVEPSGLQHCDVRVRLGLPSRQRFGRYLGDRPHDAIRVDAEERLDDRGAIEAEEYLLLQFVTCVAIGIQARR